MIKTYEMHKLEERIVEYLKWATPDQLSQIGRVCFGHHDLDVHNVERVADNMKLGFRDYGGES